MSQKKKIEAPTQVRQVRYFSEEFKRKKVNELDRKLTTVTEISRQYQVSDVAVYKWIEKYSPMRKKAIVMVVEEQSDTMKIKALKEHIAELERSLGQKQFEVDLLKKQFLIAEQIYGDDFKKKLSGKPCSGSSLTGNSTDTA